MYMCTTIPYYANYNAQLALQSKRNVIPAGNVFEDRKMLLKPFAILVFAFLPSITGDKVPCETINVCEAQCGSLRFTFNQSGIDFLWASQVAVSLTIFCSENILRIGITTHTHTHKHTHIHMYAESARRTDLTCTTTLRVMVCPGHADSPKTKKAGTSLYVKYHIYIYVCTLVHFYQRKLIYT